MFLRMHAIPLTKKCLAETLNVKYDINYVDSSSQPVKNAMICITPTIFSTKRISGQTVFAAKPQ